MLAGIPVFSLSRLRSKLLKVKFFLRHVMVKFRKIVWTHPGCNTRVYYDLFLKYLVFEYNNWIFNLI